MDGKLFQGMLDNLPRDICDVCTREGTACWRGEFWLGSGDRWVRPLWSEDDCPRFTGWPGEGVFQFCERREGRPCRT